MTETLNLSFEKKFKISNICLRMNRAHPSIARNTFWKLQFFVIISFSCFAVYCLSYSTFCHDIRKGRFSDASKNCTMLIVCVTITMKYIVLLVNQESIKELIKYIDRDYNVDNNYSDEDRKTIQEYADKGTNVCKFWAIAGCATSAIFPLKAFICMAYYYWIGKFRFVAMFEITFPEPAETYKNIPAVFWTWFVLTLWFDIYAVTMHVGFDPLIPICMLHVCGQKALLNRRLRRLFAEYENPKDIEQELKLIIKKQQSLYKFMDTFKGQFSVLLEFNMKGTTFLLPLTAFQIIEDLRNHRINLEFISFLAAAILHFFIPSYYSDLLMEKSENLRQAIYSSGWERCSDKRVRQLILFMITRTKIPMGIRTVFSEINLDTFTEMCRHSYGILNLMNAAWS